MTSLQESANWSKQLIQNQKDIDAANDIYSPNYKQAFFPYDVKHINKQFIAAPATLPAGTSRTNAKTEETCIQNAAKAFTESHSIKFDKNEFQEGEFQKTVLANGEIEVRGSLLPLDGNQNTKIVAKGLTTYFLWVNEATLTPFASNVQNSKPFIVWKYVPVPFLLRYTDVSANSTTPVLVELQRSAGTIVPTKQGPPTPIINPIYYNFNNDTKSCTIYKKDISGIEDTGKTTDVILWSKKINPDTTAVGLNEQGQLMMYTKEGTATLLLGSNKNKHTLELNSTAGTLSLGKTTVARGLDIELANTDNYDIEVYRGQITSAQKTENGVRIPEQQITFVQGLASTDNKLLLIIENGELVIKKRIKNANRLYSIQPDYKMGKTFLTDANSNIKKLIWMDPKYKTEVSEKPAIYANMYPPKNAVTSGKYKETKGACNPSELTGRTHYYEVSTKNEKSCLTPVNPSEQIIFRTQNTEYTASTLFQPFTYMDADTATPENNGYALSSTTDFTLLDTKYRPGFNINHLIPNLQKVDTKTKAEYGIKTPDLVGKPLMPITYEGFATQQQEVISNIETHLAPTYASIYGNLEKINRNAMDISAGIKQYRAAKSELEGTDIVDGVTKDKYYDFSGNTLYTLEKNRSKTTALLQDRETMLTEQNNLYIVSVISVAALFIGAIVLSTSRQ